MEKVSEILNNIKDRLSNPLIFSFLLSWLIYNWEIPVALIWYDKSQFSGCGCHTIFDFIQYKLDHRCCSFLFPLLIAFVYTGLIPFVKSGIRLLQTWVTKLTDDKELEILKGGKIGIDKYLKLRNEYNIKIDELVNIIASESETKDINLKLASEKENCLNEIDDRDFKIKQLVKKLSEIKNINLLDGQWNCSKKIYRRSDTMSEINETFNFQVIISGGDYYIVKNDIRKIKGKIKEFYYDPNSGGVFMLLGIDKSYLENKDDDEYPEYLISILKIYNDNWNYLHGTENNNEITYTRVQ